VSDLRTLLHEAADAAPVTPAATAVDADLARGRRALARTRRVRWGAAPLGLVAAAAAGAVALGGWHPAAPPVTGPPRAAAPSAGAVTAPSASTSSTTPRTATSSTTSAPRIALVAYRGDQPAGYTIDRVPQGWEVQGVDRYSLVLAPAGFPDQDTNSFEGKIVVGRANPDEIAVERQHVRTVTVDGVRAKAFVFDDPDPEPAQGLLLPVGRGKYLIFQIPGTLHWDAATVADFAAGVHITDQARAAAG
jgi:hypothetical protein